MEMNGLRLLWITSTCAALAAFAGCGGASRQNKQVVVYTSVDEVFARPICESFERETGIKVLLVPDTEETKSTGLLNRLIAEKARPQADVFWSGDPVRASILKSKGVSTPYRSPNAEDLPSLFSDPEGHWTGFSCRARVIIYNTDMVPKGEEPKSVLDLTTPRFKNKTCIANPLFGTTSMHAAALFEKLGDADARKFFDDLAANRGKILSSNGEVRRRVASGEFAVGLTDTDDAVVEIEKGMPVAIVYPDQAADGLGTLYIPNTLALIKGSPHPAEAEKLVDYLLSADVEKRLAAGPSAQIPLRPGVAASARVKTPPEIRAMEVDWSTAAGKWDVAAEFLKTEFTAP